MQNTQNDPGLPLDIETLMSRIRASVKQREADVAGPLGHSANGTLSKDSIGALQAQADFNLGLVQSLDSIADYLKKDKTSMDALQQCVQDQANRTREVGEMINSLSGLLQDVEEKAEGAKVHSSETERFVRREIERLDQAWQCRLAALENNVEQRLAKEIENSRRETGQVAEIVKDLSQTVKTTLAEVVLHHQKTCHELEEMRLRVLRAERKVRAVQSADGALSNLAGVKVGTNAEQLESSSAVRAGNAGVSTPCPPSFDYFMFEHRFRGSRDDIKHRQTAYVELFRGRQNVVDLGCGRGEFVELLKEQGIGITGVDMNEDMVDFCRDRGLPVVRAELLGYLEGVADGSLDGITAIQVIEHMSPQQLWEFVLLASRKLHEGGLILLETINANCPAALNWFYLDPTHVRPVPMELVRFMLEQAEFTQTSYILSAPLAGSSTTAVLPTTLVTAEIVGVYQDYAVVAVRK